MSIYNSAAGEYGLNYMYVCMYVYIYMYRPLVNMDPSVGPTEFVPILPYVLCLCLMPVSYACMYIQVPLVDMEAALGPTEFIPTTHLLFNYDEDITKQIKPVTFCTKAGHCLLFDYRVKHRGLGNRGTISRPMVFALHTEGIRHKA